MPQETTLPKKNNHKKIIKRYQFRLNFKNLIFYLLLVFLGVSFFLSLARPPSPAKEIPLSQVLTDVKDGKVQKIEIEDAKLNVKYKDGQNIVSRKEEGTSLFTTFKDAGVDPKDAGVEVKDTSSGQIWFALLGNFLPLLLMVLFLLFIFRQARGAQESIFSFGQSRAKLFSKDNPRITFADVAGVDEAKQELTEVVDFLKNPGKYRALGARTPKGALLLGPPGVGKCVTGETIVWTNKGLMEIREVPRYYYVDPKSHQVYGAGLASFDTDKVLSTDKFASHWFDLGKKATIKIELAQGFSLEGTPEHPVIVMGSDGKLRFRRLDQIQEDDYVAIQYGKEMFGHLEMVDEETAYLLGILTGDGNLSHSSRVGFTSIDPELIDFFKGYIKTRYAKNAITVRDQSYLVSSWDLKRYLYQMGMSYLLSFDKVVPSTVLQAPEQIQIAFLQGLFDTDAAVEKGRATIEYTTVSEKMARQVQMMLLNLGVVASLNMKGKTENGYHRPVYRLTITGSSLQAFGNLVGFRLTRKKKLLDGHVEKVKRVNTNVDVIPGIAHQLDESWRELSQKGLSNEKLAKTVDKIRRRGRVSRQTLVDYVSYASSFKINLPHLEYFRDLLEAKLFFSQVVDKSEGWARVYDFTVPKTHTFLGNGFLNHNTLLARAVAGEAGVPFFSMAGSEFMEMLVGVGSARMRDLFQTAKRNAPSIIFIDEVESIGRARSMGGVTSHDEREQTLNQMLVEMDGFTPNDNVVVVAASVAGETPVLIKKDDQIELVSIGKFIDGFFKNEDEEGEARLENVYCLGFERKISFGHLTHKNLYFQNSAFKPVSSVFRHRVEEIYEIKYLGGKIRTTGNHSVFVRTRRGLETKAVAHLKKGDILVNLPLKVNRTNKELMVIKAHHFNPSWSLTLPFFNQTLEEEWQGKYLFATENPYGFSQTQIAQVIGTSQGTISHWQRGIGNPRPISTAYFKQQFPPEIKVTPDLCRLLGYYVAEGYARKEVDFCFSIKEEEEIEDVVGLVKDIFGLTPDRLGHQTAGAVNIIYFAAPLAKFLAGLCGKGAANKHLPSFLFEAPYEYFIEFLKGVWRGDGYEDKNGRGEITSVSKRLILELNWLCRMHGIKTYIRGFIAKEGRRITGGKPLGQTKAYRLGWGKANNPFRSHQIFKTYPVKRAIIQQVKRLPFDGFVYDLCGVENEAFFGGESPVLLHNTNRPDLLDPALLRPGRFDRRVTLDMPDIEGRKDILKIHMRGKPFTPEVDWDKIAKRTVGFSGADLENMLNEAAILAARLGKKAIDMSDLEEAATKVKLGPEKRRLQSDLDKKMTAYHEAGHAIVTHQLPHMDPVHRISIVSRGLALGFTLIPPAKDRYTETQSHLLEQVASLLGGRAAEELEFSEFTAGAASDIQKATEIARTMVVEYGMSELGPINLGPQVNASDAGRIWMEPAQISPEMASKVDSEIKKIIEDAYKKAVGILKKLKNKLDLVAEELLRKETLEGEEFEKLMGGEKLEKPTEEEVLKEGKLALARVKI